MDNPVTVEVILKLLYGMLGPAASALIILVVLVVFVLALAWMKAMRSGQRPLRNIADYHQQNQGLLLAIKEQIVGVKDQIERLSARVDTIGAEVQTATGRLQAMEAWKDAHAIACSEREKREEAMHHLVRQELATLRDSAREDREYARTGSTETRSVVTAMQARVAAMSERMQLLVLTGRLKEG